MRTLAAVALGAALLVGCDDSTGPGSIAGTYQLQSVNDDPVPSILSQVGTTYRLEATGGAVTLRSDGTYTATFSLREDDNGTITTINQTEHGTWEGTASDLTLIDDSDGEFVLASVSGNTLTVDDGTDIWVYRR